MYWDVSLLLNLCEESYIWLLVLTFLHDSGCTVDSSHGVVQLLRVSVSQEHFSLANLVATSTNLLQNLSTATITDIFSGTFPTSLSLICGPWFTQPLPLCG